MRIAGITIPENKNLEIALTSLYGVGRSSARVILEKAGMEKEKKAADLTPEDENKIRTAMENIPLEGDLKRRVSGNIKHLKDIKCYRGTRHMRRLPARGQRTKVNSRTVRGNVRKTMGSGKRKVEKK